MKILLLTTHLNTGGITSYLLTLSRQLVARGHQVWLASAGGRMAPVFAASGVKCLTLNIRTKSELDPRIYLAVRQLIPLIRANGIEVIHAQTRITQVMGWWLRRWTGCGVCTTCHGFFTPRWSRRVFPCWGQRVIAISPAVGEHLQRDLGVPSGRVAVIANGIDGQEYSLISDAQRDEQRRKMDLTGGPVLGIVARLSDVKGHSVLIAAMPRILAATPQARLLIVGEGRMEAALRDQVRDLGLGEAVRFYPVAGRTAEVLAALDVFVLPSLQEGLGLSVMEAQAAGLPVVASRVGGIPSLITDGQTGRLVDPGDPDALARAVIELFSDPGQAREMGRRAREVVLRSFSAEQMAEATLRVYGQVRARGEALR